MTQGPSCEVQDPTTALGVDGGVLSFPEGQRGLMAKGLGWSRKLPKDLAPDRWADHPQDVPDGVGPGFWEGPPPTADTSLLTMLSSPFF